MRRLLRTTLVLAAGAGTFVLLDGRARSHSRRALAGARARVGRLWSREAAVDRALTVEVGERLEHLTERARAVQASSEHGCVVLTGDVLTADRGHLVREIAQMPGVDSVIDLMTEHATVDTPVLEPAKPAHAHPPSSVPPSASWGRGARVVAFGGGLGLFASGLRLGGGSGAFAAFVGALLLARALVETSRHPHAREHLPLSPRDAAPLQAW